MKPFLQKIILWKNIILQKITPFFIQYKKKRLIFKIAPLAIVIICYGLLTAYASIIPLFDAPQIISIYPTQKSRDIQLDTTIEITFDRTIKSQSSQLFFITPDIKGTFSWKNQKSFTFKPAKGFTRGQTYTFGFKSQVLSTFNTSSKETYSYTFETVGIPHVVFKAPENEAPEGKTPITVVFNQPMISLSTIENEAEIKPILEISPKIIGTGRWLGTYAYQFTPTENYSPATTYTVSLAQNLKSLDGYALDEKLNWIFSSERPHVLNTLPRADYSGKQIDPDESISAQLNLPPDPAQNLQDYFIVVNSVTQEQVKGTFFVKNNTIEFLPNTNWPRNSYFKATIKKGYKTARGPNPLEDDYTWSFKSIPNLQVEQTSPKNADSYAENMRDISVSFNLPLKESSLENNIIIDPPLERKSNEPLFECSDPTYCSYVKIFGKLKRDTQYRVTIKQGILDNHNGTLLSDYTSQFTTGPIQKHISFSPSDLQVVMTNQYTPQEVFIRTMNVSNITYSLQSISQKDFIDGENTTLKSNWDSYKPTQSALIRTWNDTITPISDEYVRNSTLLQDQNGKSLPSGYYFFQATATGGESIKIVLLVTKTTLTLKYAKDQLLVWATDQASGKPIKDMQLTITDTSGSELSKGTTNADGVSKISGLPRVSDYQNNLYVIGKRQDDISIASTRWNNGIGNYAFGLNYYYNNHNEVDYPIYLVFDRPLYRPGHKVYYKGILRKDTDGAFETVSNSEEVELIVSDTQNKEIYRDKKKLNSFGTFSGDFTLSSGASTGTYYLKAKYVKEGTFYNEQFQVEEYKRPDYKVMIKPTKNNFVRGENVQFNINASYYFGAPIKNAEAFYQVKSEDYTITWDEHPEYEFGNPDSYWYRPWSKKSSGSDNSIKEDTVQLNGKGNADLSIPIDMSQATGSKRIMVDTAVTDINNQTVGASEIMYFHKSNVFVGIKPHEYVGYMKKDTQIDIATLSPQKTRVGNKQVSIDVKKIDWVSTREENDENGGFYYRNKQIENFVTSINAKTNENGEGNATFIPETGGTYKVIATVADDNGNTSTSSTYLWIVGNEFASSRENHDRIQLITDKYEYKVGDTAELFISTPFGKDIAKTLITYERGTVLDYKVIDINEDKPTYSIPINTQFVPNMFVGAVLVRGSADPKMPPEFKMGYTEVRVIDKTKKLNVEISTDKETYSPRDKVSTHIKVRDEKGNPVQAELSLSLVDRALLDLSSITYTHPYDFFFTPKGLGVNTAQNLTFSLNRINVNVNSGSKGGDGDTTSSLSTKRKFFPETDYWSAHLVTNQNGEAVIEIPLADNLTTWKFTAVANSKKDAFGTGTHEIMASKEVLIRPLVPRFLATGDTSSIGGIVMNQSNKDLTMTMQISTTGVQLTDSESKSFTLKNGEQQTISWNVVATDTTTSLIRLFVKNIEGKILDDVEVTIPIVTYHTPEVVASAGEVKTEQAEKIFIPQGIDKKQGRVELNLSKSLLGSTLNGLSYLSSYPYGCSEQITSKLSPSISLYTFMKQSGVSNFGNHTKEELTGLIQVGVQKLQSMQHSSGGWAWWTEAKEANPFLSAYVYDVLSEAKAQNFGVSDQTLLRAKAYLTNQLGYTTNESFEELSYIIYTLRNDSSVSIDSYLNLLYDNRMHLSLEGKAYLAISMSKIGNHNNQLDNIKSELYAVMKKTSTGIHWENPTETYSYMGDSSTTTASILKALLYIDQNNPLLSEIARYIQTSLQKQYSYTTRSVSSMINTLVLYSQLKGDLNSSYTAKTYINSSKWETIDIRQQDVLKTISLQKPIASLKIGNQNTIKIAKSGQGVLYYNLLFKYFLPYADIKPVDRGFTVMRTYENTDGSILDKTTIKAGDMFRVRLTVVSPESHNYVLLEDKLPGGFEAVNENLNGTSNATPSDKNLKKSGVYELYFTRKEYHDDRVAYFVDSLARGVYEVSYLIRATTPGKYHHPPTQISEIYMPDIFGHTEGGWIEIKE
ncbi:MAG: Ig-like domain-containing protein [Candidatus Roizmanbacteria bacterium]